MEAPAGSLAQLGSWVWIWGLIVLAASAGSLALSIPRTHGRPVPDPIWDITRTAQIYTTIVGSFAGFAAASTVFVARLGFDRPTQAFEELMGLLALSFMMLATSAMQFGNTPNAPGLSDPGFLRAQRLSFLVSNTALTQGVVVSWLSLQTLTVYIGLAGLGEALGIFMILVVGLGLLRITQYIHDFTSLPGKACLAVAPIAVASAAVYFYGFGLFAPELLPPSGEPFHYAFSSAVLVGSGFLGQSVMFSARMHGRFTDTVSWRVEQLATGHCIVALTFLCLLAFSMLAR